MRRILARLVNWSISWSLVAILFWQLPGKVVADEPAAPVDEPVVSAAETTVVKENPATEEVAEEKIASAKQPNVVVASTKPRQLFQHATYPDAWKAAQKSNRPILVYVSMPNCRYCVKMKEQVFHLPRVKQLVANSFETVRADRYTHSKLVQKLRVRWYPTTVLVGPNNRILDVIEGYADANKFQQRLQTGLASLKNSPTAIQTR